MLRQVNDDRSLTVEEACAFYPNSFIFYRKEPIVRNYHKKDAINVLYISDNTEDLINILTEYKTDLGFGILKGYNKQCLDNKR